MQRARRCSGSRPGPNGSQLATEPARLGAEHLDAARAAGLDDDDIWDVGAITAVFALSNRMAQLTALRPNPEFFLLGRVPRT